MRKKILLGTTNENNLVFANIELTERNGYPEFTASFDEVRPFKGSDFDIVEYFEQYVEGLPDECAYGMCRQFDCKPTELAQCLALECSDPRDALDCSLFSEWYLINGEEWYFESVGCGQCDVRNDMKKYVNKQMFDKLMFMWDLCHLRTVNKDACAKAINEIVEAHDLDWTYYITEFIRREVA